MAKQNASTPGLLCSLQDHLQLSLDLELADHDQGPRQAADLRDPDCPTNALGRSKPGAHARVCREASRLAEGGRRDVVVGARVDPVHAHPGRRRISGSNDGQSVSLPKVAFVEPTAPVRILLSVHSESR